MGKEQTRIAGYCRISFDEEHGQDNTSIENQKAIISDYTSKKFPTASLDFFCDRDRSGFLFEQRENYQRLRGLLLDHTYDILIVKDFSRFSRNLVKGLFELQNLNDAGVRVISICDDADFTANEDMLDTKIRFLINERLVIDTSKKERAVIRNRQASGKWICAVPYGYVITDTKEMSFKIDTAAAETVKLIFSQYNNGWGYKKIAGYLTGQNIPTPRMSEKLRKEAEGEKSRIMARDSWSIATVSGILKNDFYIGTLRQGKYSRKKINGSSEKVEEEKQIIFENHHEPIVEEATFSLTQELLAKRTKNNYRGAKKHSNAYSGLMFCGDCGRPMFAVNRSEKSAAYICSSYYTRGAKVCTSHRVHMDLLDSLAKAYISRVCENSAEMLKSLNRSLCDEQKKTKGACDDAQSIKATIVKKENEIKAIISQRANDVCREPARADFFNRMYEEAVNDCYNRLQQLNKQLEQVENGGLESDNSKAKTAPDVFNNILNKSKLSKADVEAIVERITVFSDRIEISLKADIDALLTEKTIDAEQQPA